MSARKRDRQSYQSLYGINRRGKVTGEKAANKQGKRLCHGREMRRSKVGRSGKGK